VAAGDPARELDAIQECIPRHLLDHSSNLWFNHSPAMPRPASTTRDRIILAAVELFYSQGYEATGMAQILKKSRANSGSFYFFFESKDHLLDAVLDWYLANLRRQ
jgi:hypothetical protein